MCLKNQKGEVGKFCGLMGAVDKDVMLFGDRKQDTVASGILCRYGAGAACQ